MALIEHEALLAVLRGYNPWWSSGSIPVALNQKIKRGAFYECKKIIHETSLNRAVVLAGPRRVGKTTILYQLADLFIHNGFEPKDILYFSIEHPILKLANIETIIQIYTNALSTNKGNKVILIDEIQYTDEPRIWLKVLVDQHPEWKIVATGSASIGFTTKDKESGVGRWVTIPVHTLSFFEYVLLRTNKVQDIRMPEGLPKKLLPMYLEKKTDAELLTIQEALEPLREVFNDFLLKGGFPETTLLHDLNLVQRLLREDVVDKVLKRDMAAFYGIRTLPELEKLFVYLCMHPGLIIDQGTVAQELRISLPQVTKLLHALRAAYLIRELPGYQQSGKKALKGKSKWYIVDASMRNAVLLKDKSLLLNDLADTGMIVETATINELAVYKYETMPRLGYWRSKNKKKEVDILVDAPSAKTVAVEVKYKSNVLDRDIQGLLEFAMVQKEVLYVVVTKESKDFGSKKVMLKNGQVVSVNYVPAFMFLYLLGRYQYEKNK